MKPQMIFGLLAILFLVGTITPSIAQESFDETVIINEVDLNPPGDDSKSVSEWVELYNPTDSEINVSGWQIASTTILKKTFTIPVGTIIKPDGFLIYSYQSLWFNDVAEVVELRDFDGNVVDKTHAIKLAILRTTADN